MNKRREWAGRKEEEGRWARVEGDGDGDGEDVGDW